jgi:hypothetical protein
MKIEKDNLTSKQKINAYLGIVFLSILLFSFFYYKSYLNKNRKELLSKNTEITFCKIIGFNTHKNVTNYLEYYVNGKKYETQPLGKRSVKIGEFYQIKYSKSNPEISEIDFTKPIILDNNDYKIENGIVTETYENEKWKILTFEYSFEKRNYERDVYLKKIGDFKKGKKIEIMINSEKPEISYLKEQIENQ